MFSNERVLQNPNIVGAAAAEAGMATERLREIVEQHQVCYEVWPEWYMKDGIKIQIGFELQLCGINHEDQPGSSHHAIPGCPICFKTYSELLEIAKWVLPVDERPTRSKIQAFDHALHIASAKRFRRREVVVTIVIMHRSDFNRPVDDCEHRCLKEMRQRLSQLGIHEDVWRENKGLKGR